MEISIDQLYDLANVIGLAVAGMAVAISSMWIVVIRTFRRVSASEVECRKQLDELWRQLTHLKQCQHHYTVDELMEKWPDRRSGTERRNGSTDFSKFKTDRRSGAERRTTPHC